MPVKLKIDLNDKSGNKIDIEKFCPNLRGTEAVGKTWPKIGKKYSKAWTISRHSGLDIMSLQW